MSIDPYAPCPGGTGKKIKFCCPDLVGELEKIHRMLDGDQRAACLDYLETIEGKYPDRACLLSVKSMLEAQLGREEKAASTLASYIEKYPDNPVALAEAAILAANKEGGRAAVAPLQKAIFGCAQGMPPQVYDALSVVAQALIAEGHIQAARAHLAFQLGIGAAERDEQTMNLLVRINGAAAAPLLLKQDEPLVQAPEGALWKTSFSTAMDLAHRGAWQAAADKLLELANQAGDWPEIWRNLATLRGWLADTPGQIEALRKYDSQKVPLDDAVEAEALAELLEPAGFDMVDVLTINYPILDIEAFTARFTASPKAIKLGVDLSRMSEEGQPPPKNAFFLIDRPLAKTGVGLTRAEVSHIVGQVFLFGKQTDREARTELVVYRGAESEQGQAILAEIAQDALGPAGAEAVTTQVPLVQHVLSWNWRLPGDTPAEVRAALIADERREVLLDRWPTLSQKMFDGRTAADAATDPAYRVKVLAAVLNLELSTSPTDSQVDFNELRRKLNLPTADAIIPPPGAIQDLPLCRLARVDIAKLSDQDLLYAYQRADHFRFIKALRMIASEIVARPSLDKAVDKAEAYGVLAQLESDPKRSLEYIELARKAAEAAGSSSGPWDIAELTLRIGSGEIQEAERLLQHIQREHIREPGIAQALYQVLAEAGIIGPDGRPTAAPAAAAAPGIVVPGGAATAEPGKIWTPGSEPAAGGGKKSALWVPE